MSAFEQFVRGGGTVICLNSASNFAIQQLKLPVKNVATGLRSEDFFLHGTIVEVITDPSQQVMAGMPDKAAVFADSSPVFETQDGFKGKVLARYQDTGSPLLSGYLIGEKYLNGKAAALDVQLDAGHVILLGFRPEWRGQPFGTFKVTVQRRAQRRALISGALTFSDHARAKSMKPRRGSVLTSRTRTLSPTSSPSAPRASRPSTGVGTSRTQVPLGPAPVTTESNVLPICGVSHSAAAALPVSRSTLFAASSCLVQ